MLETEEQRTPENETEQLPRVETAPAGETSAETAGPEVSPDELRQIEAQKREAEVKLAWEKKQAGELVKEAYQAHQEAGPALDEFELDVQAGLNVPKVPEVPEKMGRLSEREKDAARQRRADARDRAGGWLHDLSSVSLSEYLHGENNFNANSAAPNPEYEGASKRLFDAETRLDLLRTGRGRYTKAKAPAAYEEARRQKSEACQAMAAAAGKTLAKGDANALYLWNREYLRHQAVETLKKSQTEKEQDLPKNEKELRQLGIDTEALYRSRTEDAAERAGDKEKKYRLPLRQTVNLTARRTAARYVAARDSMNQGLDQAAKMHGQLDDHEGLWQQTRQEHEKLLTEASAEAKPGTGQRIEFKTPELADRYQAVVDELVWLEKTLGYEDKPDGRQAKYKLEQLIAAKLPNIPGLRLQAMSDAKEAAAPK